MHTDVDIKYQHAMDEIARELIETVAIRYGDSQPRRIARQQAAAWSISSLQPRDPTETMLAGQCVIFDHLLRDGARDMLDAQDPNIKLRVRPQVLAAGKMFLAHLDRLEQMQTRLADEPAARASVGQAASATAGPDVPPKAAAPAGVIRPPASGQQPGSGQQPAFGEPAGTAIAPAKANVPPPAMTAASTAASPGAHTVVEAVAEVGRTTASEAVGAAPQGGPPAIARQEPTRQANVPPAVRPASVVQAADHSPQTTNPVPNAAGDTVRAPSGMLPNQPNPRNQLPSRAEAERVRSQLPQSQLPQSQLARTQTVDTSRHVEALAMLTASLTQPPSPGPSSETSSALQPSAAARPARAEAPV